MAASVPSKVNFRAEADRREGLTVALHDTRGRLVNELEVSARGAVVWDGRDRSGRTVASSLYLAVLRERGVERDRAKVMLVK